MGIIYKISEQEYDLLNELNALYNEDSKIYVISCRTAKDENGKNFIDSYHLEILDEKKYLILMRTWNKMVYKFQNINK
tara:strand:- start:108 stop:341 length:234 start_codon:yes stop_codon:yes gene_type:complete